MGRSVFVRRGKLSQSRDEEQQRSDPRAGPWWRKLSGMLPALTILLVVAGFIDDGGLTGAVVGGAAAVFELEQKVAARGLAQLVRAGQKQAAEKQVGDG